MTEERTELEFFQNLEIHGSDEQLAATKAWIFDALTKGTAPGWSRVTLDRLRYTAPDEDVIALDRAADGVAPAAGLFMARYPGRYEITNIVPAGQGELGRRRYNAILQDFVLRLATPACSIAGARLDVSLPTHTLEESLGVPAARSLRQFSAAANMSTGSSHPLDRRRWYDFILLVRNDDVNTGTLSRWLMALGWPEDSAHRLTSEFEFGHGLLQHEKRG